MPSDQRFKSCLTALPVTYLTASHGDANVRNDLDSGQESHGVPHGRSLLCFCAAWCRALFGATCSFALSLL